MMGLKKKTFIYVGVGLGALMVLLTLLSLQTINRAIDMVRQERLALVENVASGINEIIKHLHTEIANTAIVLGQEWQDEVTDSYQKELASLHYHLRQHLIAFPQVEQAIFVAVLDARGKVLWTEPYLAQKVSQSLADTTAVRKAVEKGQVYLETEQALLTQGSPTLSLVAPINDSQGVLRGVLITDILALPGNSGFGVFLQQRQGDYHLELVTKSGLVIASSTAELAFEESFHWEVIRHLAEARLSGVETHYHTPGREATKAHLVAFVPLAKVDWGVVMVQSQEQVLELPWIMGRRLLLVSGLVVLGIAGLAWIITRHIVNPLQRLAFIAQRFGSGDLEARVPAMGQDEIGKLAESLDTMRHQLKHSLDEIKEWNQELEQRVKQRTKELEELSQQLNERNRERGDLLSRIITAQEEERRSIARELHDEVGQLLTSLMVRFKALEAQEPEKIQPGITELKRLAAQTLDEVHHLALELRPSSLDDLGLVAALEQYTTEYSDKLGISADFQATGLEAKRLPPQVEIVLYRIIQEALTNVAKHSAAKKVSVLIGLRDSSVVAIVEDNGKGFDVQKVLASRTKEQKLGLYGMQERAALIDGVLTIESTPGVGTTIFVEVPLKGDGVK